MKERGEKMQGSVINSYFYCKKKSWLLYNRIGLEHNSEDVEIGKALHKIKEGKNSEISIEDIKIDSITDNYLIEIKKSDSDVNAALWQIKYYLYILDKKGISRKGKLQIIEKNNHQNNIIIEFNEQTKQEIEEKIIEIENTVNQDKIPLGIEDMSKCKKCAYYDYCYI